MKEEENKDNPDHCDSCHHKTNQLKQYSSIRFSTNYTWLCSYCVVIRENGYDQINLARSMNVLEERLKSFILATTISSIDK